MNNRIPKSLLVIYFICMQSSAGAAIVYDELVSGDFPDLNVEIPVLEVAAGSNFILGELGKYPDTADSFHIDLRDGFRLESIIVTRFPVPENGYKIGFNLFFADSARHIHINQLHLGVDILPLLNRSWGPGFTLPLENDTIEISLLQTLSRNKYGLDIVVSHVPVPPALWFFGFGLLSLVGVTRRKKAS